jgi:hypothetical protein
MVWNGFKRFKDDLPLDPWCPNLSQWRREEHDSEHFWHSDKYLAFLWVMYTIIARVYRPAAPWPLSSECGMNGKLIDRPPGTSFLNLAYTSAAI